MARAAKAERAGANVAWPKGKPRNNAKLAVVEEPELKDPREIWDRVPFYPSDFACKCGNYCMTDVPMLPQLLLNLDKIAKQLDYPLAIREGVRCSQRHWDIQETNGAAHLIQEDGFCHAADIICSDETRHDILRLALQYFPHVGVNEGFIHVDIMDNSPKSCWVYGLDER